MPSGSSSKGCEQVVQRTTGCAAVLDVPLPAQQRPEQPPGQFEQQSQRAATRKSLVGSGDRSERIRTYNFPQGRVTDHRVNLTLYKIAAIMDGDLFELTDALIAEHQADLLAQLSEETASA